MKTTDAVTMRKIELTDVSDADLAKVAKILKGWGYEADASGIAITTTAPTMAVMPPARIAAAAPSRALRNSPWPDPAITANAPIAAASGATRPRVRRSTSSTRARTRRSRP